MSAVSETPNLPRRLLPADGRLAKYCDKILGKLLAVSLRLMKVEYHSDHLLMPHLLGRGSKIIDIGGNLGAFSLDVSKSFGSAVFVVEPDPNVYSRIASSALVRKFNLAIGDRNGSIDFFVSPNSQASSFNLKLAQQWGEIKAISVRTVTLGEFLNTEKISTPDLVKIDAEGWEINILNGLSEQEIRRVAQFTVEFHDHLDPSLRQPTLQVLTRMKALGFYVIVTSKASFSHVLFLNAKLIKTKRWFWLGYCLCRLVRRGYSWISFEGRN